MGFRGIRQLFTFARSFTSTFAFTFLVITIVMFTAADCALAATRTWTGAGITANWLEDANWDTGAPQNGDSLVFPAGVTKMATSNDAVGLVVQSLQFSGSAYQIQGNGFHLGAGGIQVLAAPSSTVIEVPVQLDADQTWSGPTGLTLSAAGSVAMNAHTVTIQIPIAEQIAMNGPISSSAGATGYLFVRSGTVAVAGASSSTFVVVLDGTVLISNSSGPAGAVVARDDGTLSLSNGVTMGMVTIGPGSLDLTQNGAATVNAASLSMIASSFHIGGTRTPVYALGQLKVASGVTLGGSSLVLDLPSGFTPPIGTSFTIIDQGGTFPVQETFFGLPEGAYVTFGAATFQVSYVGGTGNDVTLKVVATTVPGDYFLSEGATGSFFTTDILLANYQATSTGYTITFLKEDGSTATVADTIAANAHKLVRVNDIPGMESAAFSTHVQTSAGSPLVVERTMSWDQRGYGAHTEHAVDGTATTWYFAEGSQGFFHTYLLLMNPQATANTATVQYLREGEPPVTRTYAMGPTTRLTVDAGSDPSLVNRSFGMIVTFDQPGGAERAMYFGDSPAFNGGHESAGVSFPASTWFLAEGATGPFFETFILLANPGSTDANVSVVFLPSVGVPMYKMKTVPAHGRLTINIEGEDPSLANAAVATQVVSSQPILVERSQYWPDPAPSWYEAHNSFGVSAIGEHWGFAEGRVGGSNNAQTYILIANPGRDPAHVHLRFLREGGLSPISKDIVVPALSRANIPVGPGTDVPELNNENFGADITSDQPIAVERSLYWDAIGQTWAAGTNATAMRLP